MKQEMLINVSQPEESRIAIVEDGVLEELYIEHTGADNYVGNIYKGVVVNLEPSIQAAFIDFGPKMRPLPSTACQEKPQVRIEVQNGTWHP